MIAVIETGGKQYLVKTGDAIKIEKLAVKEGEKVVFDKVLLTAKDDGSDVKIGTPYLEMTVEASVEMQGRAKKILVEKFKRKVRYHKVYGHKQPFTKVKIN